MKEIKLKTPEVFKLANSEAYGYYMLRSAYPGKVFEVVSLDDLAEELGMKHGQAAASWVVSPEDMSKETYERIQQQLKDNDPELLDALPHADFSGEMADGMTPEKLLAEIGVEAEVLENYSADEVRWLKDRMVDSYTQVFDFEVQLQLEREARLYLSTEED